MLSRNDQTIITWAEWVKEGDLWWYTVRTSTTGAHEFRIIGSDEANLVFNQRHSAFVRGLTVGAVTTIGNLHTVPVNHGWAAMIKPGVFMEVGIMQDGLNGICGPQVFAHFKDNTSSQNNQPTDAHVAIARSAAEIYVRQGAPRAREVLEMSGLFHRVLGDDRPSGTIGPAWGSPDVWEPR